MKKHSIKRCFYFISVFLATLLLFGMLTYTYVQNKSNMEYAQMEQLVTQKASKVSDVIQRLLYKTQTLSALAIQNDGRIEDFERVAATIIDDPSIRNVLLAPNGIVSHVYPVAGNESVVGFDLFSKSAGNQEAILARDTGELVLGGPFPLVQGGQAIVGRFPVYIENGDSRSFWGLVSVTLNYPDALAGAELQQLQIQGFAYEIWRISPDTEERQIISSSDYDYDTNALYVEKKMNLLNAAWYFRLSPIHKWYEYPETWLFLTIGIMASLLMAILVLHNHDLRKVKIELELISNIDPLTGILNRRGLFKKLSKLFLLPNSSFSIYYLDLNNFKSVNDTFGHATGDRMLQHFANTLRKKEEEGYLIGRIGGDEFLLVCPFPEKIQETEEYLNRLHSDLVQSIYVDEHPPLDIGFCHGFARYPQDASTIDGLLHAADSAMYCEKCQLKTSHHPEL